MNSIERHERRYQRRKAARERKRREFLDIYDDFDKAANPAALINAHWDSKRGVMWKYSPAKYDQNYIKNCTKSAEALQNGKNVCLGFNRFPVIERGKLRDVHSTHYTERVIRRAFCIESLVPMLSHNLIYDNGASLPGKGVSFAEKRTMVHLLDYYKEYGDNEGYAIIIDFKNYFGNIAHEKLFENVDKYIYDERLNRQVRAFVKAGDMEKPEEEKGKGLFIGPEDSQILAISYPNYIDHYIKDKLRQKWYARYNDDSYIIVRTKEEARTILDELLKLYDEYGIIPNKKKTQIVKLSKGFSFLKTKYYLQQNGRVVRKPDHDGIVRERRKLKSFKRFIEAGQMVIEQVRQSYMSWRGHIRRGKNSGETILNMDKLFYKLFGVKPGKNRRGKDGK